MLVEKRPSCCSPLKVSALVVAAGMLCGCGVFDNVPVGAESLLAGFQGPSPIDAATWATDPYDADKRYRGTLLLANAPWANEPVHLALYQDAAKDPDPSVRVAGLRGLSIHGDESHAAVLAAALKDEDTLVRINAARGLQRIHSREAVEPLLAAARAPQTGRDATGRPVELPGEPSADVRAEAASALGQYPESRVVLRLFEALGDPQLSVNHAALSSLRTLTGQDFGYDRAAWVRWFDSASEAGTAFAAQRTYVYPSFQRDKRLIEYLPFFPAPPNEVPSTPVGMPRSGT